jgi:hypothetical protein
VKSSQVSEIFVLQFLSGYLSLSIVSGCRWTDHFEQEFMENLLYSLSSGQRKVRMCPTATTRLTDIAKMVGEGSKQGAKAGSYAF